MTNTKPFDLDALIAEAKQDPFLFTFQGREIALPNMGSLPADELMLVQTATLERQIEFVNGLAELGDGLTLASLPVKAFNALIEAWFAHAGLDLGEVDASKP